MCILSSDHLLWYSVITTPYSELVDQGSVFDRITIEGFMEKVMPFHQYQSMVLDVGVSGVTTGVT